jgi:ACS family hexuronate transporter-like MFS transporter
MTDPMSSRRAWLLCTLLFVAGALSYLDRQVLSILAPKITAEFGMNAADYSRVLNCFVLSYTVMFALGGRLMDALGTRIGLTLSVGFWSLASAAHAFTVGPISLGLARFGLGAGEGPCFPAVTKGAMEWVGARRRALAVGFANGGSSFGAFLAPPLTVWVTSMVGWRGTFVAVALIGVVWVVAWQLAFRGTPVATGAPARNAKVSFRELLSRAQVRRLMLARFFFDPVYYFYSYWIPLYLAKERGLSMAQIGALTWIPFLILGLVKIDAGRVSDGLVARGWRPKTARMRMMLIAAVLTPASWFCSQAGSTGLAITLMCVLMFAHGIWITNFIALIADTFRSTEVATVVGLTGTAGGIAGLLANQAIGSTVDRFSYTPVFLVTAVLYPTAWLVLRLGSLFHEDKVSSGVPA